MTEKSIRRPHFINSRLLDALGGEKKATKLPSVSLVNDGAYLWGVEDREKGKGILNHVLKTSRVAYCLAKDLQEKKVKGYENLNLQNLTHAAILHDVTKLFGEDREKLPPELKDILEIPRDFQEISPEVDEVGVSWLQHWGFPEDVYQAIIRHDFPERVVRQSLLENCFVSRLYGWTRSDERGR